MKLMLVGHVTATTWWMQYVLISFTLSYFVVHLKVMHFTFSYLKKVI